MLHKVNRVPDGTRRATLAARPPHTDADLEMWFWRIISASHPVRVGSELRRAEREALQLFPAPAVSRAIQRAMEMTMAYWGSANQR